MSWAQVAATGALMFFSLSIIWPRWFQLAVPDLQIPLRDMERLWAVCLPVVLLVVAAVIGADCVYAQAFDGLWTGSGGAGTFRPQMWLTGLAVGYYVLGDVRIRLGVAAQG